MIRTLIVDDEPPARRGIRIRLEREADIDIVGEAGDGPAAVDALRSLKPDLLFLDVQMPGMNGFEVLAQVRDAPLPQVVFVTAFDAHALRAFEIHALDYLCKPLTEERFGETLRRVRELLALKDAESEQRRLAGSLDELRARLAGPGLAGSAAAPSRFAVRERNRVVYVAAANLVAAEAAANYVYLVEPTRRHLLRLTLNEMELLLDPTQFVRVHRSTIVNARRVRELRLDASGGGEVLLEGGVRCRMSRAFREQALARLGRTPA